MSDIPVSTHLSYDFITSNQMEIYNSVISCPPVVETLQQLPDSFPDAVKDKVFVTISKYINLSFLQKVKNSLPELNDPDFPKKLETYAKSLAVIEVELAASEKLNFNDRLAKHYTGQQDFLSSMFSSKQTAGCPKEAFEPLDSKKSVSSASYVACNYAKIAFSSYKMEVLESTCGQKDPDYLKNLPSFGRFLRAVVEQERNQNLNIGARIIKDLCSVRNKGKRCETLDWESAFDAGSKKLFPSIMLSEFEQPIQSKTAAIWNSLPKPKEQDRVDLWLKRFQDENNKGIVEREEARELAKDLYASLMKEEPTITREEVKEKGKTIADKVDKNPPQGVDDMVKSAKDAGVNLKVIDGEEHVEKFSKLNEDEQEKYMDDLVVSMFPEQAAKRPAEKQEEAKKADSKQPVNEG